MPKGNRGKRDYEREIEEAARRMRKYPEHLRAAIDSEEWRAFLMDIGIKPEILDFDRGRGFWDSVRDKVVEPFISGFTLRGLAEQGVIIAPIKYKSGEQVRLREYGTGKFTSQKKLEKR